MDNGQKDERAIAAAHRDYKATLPAEKRKHLYAPWERFDILSMHDFQLAEQEFNNEYKKGKHKTTV